MIKYKVATGFKDIKKVKIIKQTKKCVYLSVNCREFKRSSFINYFDSFNEAKQFLLDALKSKINDAKRLIDIKQDEYIEIASMTENE